MIGLPAGTRVWLAAGATDMRKGFDGLSALVIDIIDEDPQSGHLFVFFNRRRDLMKAVVWDGSGYASIAEWVTGVGHVACRTPSCAVSKARDPDGPSSVVESCCLCLSLQHR